MKKLIRITTVPISLEKLLENQLSFMSQYFDVTAISSDKEKLKGFGKNQNVATFHVDLTRKITPIKDLFALIKLYKYLKKEKPFIVHTHTPKAGIVGMLASYFAKVPNRLHTVAGLPLMEATGFKRMLLNYIEKLTYSCATKVYPNSFGLNEFILENKFTKKEKLKIIANGSSNGIDTNHFNPDMYSLCDILNFKKSLKINKEDFVFLFIGRVVGDKGINELVTAFQSLSETYSSVKLLLVGPLELELDPLDEETVNAIRENQQIITVGFQQDVRPYLALSNVLVFPSYREGFPNVVMQAGAMALPSIVSNINGCNELIINNKNGFIVPVKNTEELLKSMKSYFLNANDTDNMSIFARDNIKHKYNRTSFWEALLFEYKSLEKNV